MIEFESSYRRHLVVEQRRAVLEALAERLGETVTMGDVLDAADGLGWSGPMGELTLADLAHALLRPPRRAPEAKDDAPEALEEDEDEDDEDEDEDDAVTELAPAQEVEQKAKSKAKSTTKSKAKPKAKPKAEKKAPAAKKPKASSRTKAARLKALRAKIDGQERMSLDEAAEHLVPIVEELAQATMQDLEDFTGIGRRKLRFHIGQLVRHEYLERHGMGRGTYYTASE